MIVIRDHDRERSAGIRIGKPEAMHTVVIGNHQMATVRQRAVRDDLSQQRRIDRPGSMEISRSGDQNDCRAGGIGRP